MAVFILAVTLLLIAAAVVAFPLVFGALESYVAPDQPDAEYRESDALLEAMSELEQSHGSGKLSEQDYEEAKRRLQNQYLKAAGDREESPRKRRKPSRAKPRAR